MASSESKHLPQAGSLPTRTRPVQVVVLHTPGRTFAGRVAEGVDTMTAAYGEAAVTRYARTGLEYFGHLLVTPSAHVFELAPVDRLAWHTARLSWHYKLDSWRELAKPLGEDWARHGRDPAVVYDWWDARWGKAASPLDLTAGERSINSISIGVDVLPFPDGTYTDAQVEATARLCAQLCAAHGLEPGPRTILGHEDVDPCRRGTVRRGERVVGVGWDPGRSWPRERFYDAVARLADGGAERSTCCAPW